MFQDMRNPCCIGRVRLETDAEDVVLVLPRDMQIVGSSLIVVEMQGREFQLGYVLGTVEGEAMQAGSWLWESGEVYNGCVPSSASCLCLANGARVGRNEARGAQ